jgi:hypothetical protein
MKGDPSEPIIRDLDVHQFFHYHLGTMIKSERFVNFLCSEKAFSVNGNSIGFSVKKGSYPKTLFRMNYVAARDAPIIIEPNLRICIRKNDRIMEQFTEGLKDFIGNVQLHGCATVNDTTARIAISIYPDRRVAVVKIVYEIRDARLTFKCLAMLMDQIHKTRCLVKLGEGNTEESTIEDLEEALMKWILEVVERFSEKKTHRVEKKLYYKIVFVRNLSTPLGEDAESFLSVNKKNLTDLLLLMPWVEPNTEAIELYGSPHRNLALTKQEIILVSQQVSFFLTPPNTISLYSQLVELATLDFYALLVLDMILSTKLSTVREIISARERARSGLLITLKYIVTGTFGRIKHEAISIERDRIEILGAIREVEALRIMYKHDMMIRILSGFIERFDLQSLVSSGDRRAKQTEEIWKFIKEEVETQRSRAISFLLMLLSVLEALQILQLLRNYLHF